MKKHILSLFVVGFASTTFAGHFTCYAPTYLIRGRTEDTKVLESLTLNQINFTNLKASDELKIHQGLKYLSFELLEGNEESVQVLLNPNIDNFEDHETFVGYLLQSSNGNTESTELQCKMD